MRFDGWANCWDICTEFGDEPVDDIDFDDDVLHPELPFNVFESDRGQLEASEGNRLPDVGYQKEVEAEEGEIEEGQLEDGDLDVGTAGKKQLADALSLLRGEYALELEYSLEDLAIALDTVAYEHYGFTGDLVDTGPASERLDWATARKLLGDDKWLDNPDNVHFKLIDLPNSRRGPIMQHMYLIGRCHASLFGTIPSLNLADQSNFIHSSEAWPFSIRKIEVDGAQWYMLTEKASQLTVTLHLLICDPVAVVQIVRCNWGSTALEVANQLVNHGIRFHTLRKGRRPDAVKLRRPLVSSPSWLPESILGYQNSDYQADVHDLRAYEAERNWFLHSNRGRAAVMYGGIIGRIAREVVMDEDVIHGPDLDTIYH
ncbi:hypothetical protein PM082_023215 [Marasmius tenuissimus]|nr:hypothetical protein PM082_023215 [Marasmius tenuissimus]